MTNNTDPVREQRARDLLAAEYERDGLESTADRARSGDLAIYMRAPFRAIVSALASAPPSAPDDVNRLVRELDVALNGPEGAAAQASLCDLVSQVQRIVRERGTPLLAPSAPAVVDLSNWAQHYSIGPDALGALRNLLSLAQQPAAVGDWVLVPRVPTLDMANAAWRELESQGIDPEDVEAQQVWGAMLAAAPQQPTGPGWRLFAADVLGNPMREYAPGKWEYAQWPSQQPAAPSGDAVLNHPRAFGLMCTVAWTELVQALRKDGHQVKDSSGPNVRKWIESMVRDSLAAPQQPAGVDEAAAIRAFEEHFQASSDDPYFEGELELWLTAWRKALAAQQQGGAE